MDRLVKITAVGFVTAPLISEPVAAEEWEFVGSLYLWAAGIDGTTSFGSDFEIDFSDVIDNLDFGVLGSLEARRGKWFVLGDLVYLDVSAGNESTRTALPSLPSGGFTIDSTARVEVQGTVLNTVGGYELFDSDGIKLQGLAGARYLNIDTDLDLQISAGPVQNSVDVSQGDDVLDAIIGIRGRADISDNWFVPFYFDVGVGESDFTWQAFSGIGYDFARSDVVFGYRHIEWDFGSGGLISDIAFSGFGIKYAYRF